MTIDTRDKHYYSAERVLKWAGFPGEPGCEKPYSEYPVCA